MILVGDLEFRLEIVWLCWVLDRLSQNLINNISKWTQTNELKRLTNMSTHHHICSKRRSMMMDKPLLSGSQSKSQKVIFAFLYIKKNWGNHEGIHRKKWRGRERGRVGREAWVPAAVEARIRGSSSMVTVTNHACQRKRKRKERKEKERVTKEKFFHTWSSLPANGGWELKIFWIVCKKKKERKKK